LNGYTGWCSATNGAYPRRGNPRGPDNK